MSNTPRTGRPTADHVDPPTPVSTPPVVDPAPDAGKPENIGPDLSDEEIEVKTSGAFLLMDPQTGKHFDEDTPVKTPQTRFVVEQLDRGQLVKA